MDDAAPSRTALRVASHRAAHQLFDSPLVFDDPLALAIIGADGAGRLRAAPEAHQDRFARAFRAFMVARSRFAEDELARAVRRGASQYIILGAGLDTFAYRNPYRSPDLRVFEVDHPATQEWKRGLLASAAIAIPASVTLAPVDFERQTLADGLARAGFDGRAPTFFSWLGVTMYLTHEAVALTLAFIATTAPGGGLVFDYAAPRSSLSPTGQLALDALSRRVAAAGEPFQTFFDPRTLEGQLARIGFRSIEDLGADELNARYFSDRADGLRVSGTLARLMRAEV
jgi:methyltransferase (TIGR00027 family)